MIPKKKENKKYITSIFVLFFSVSLYASSVDVVKTLKDSNGWKLQVNNKDFYLKGMVWGYTPKNENYTFNLWEKSDEDIKAVIDHDFSLMAKAGVTAIRSFAIIPPKWVTYINDTYNIKSVINPLMGRYGTTVNGKWTPNTDYSDPSTRKVLKKEVIDTINKYKDVPGVIMFALGNESNYGLSWKSFEIENLPVGEQNKAKAEYLYSLFAETIKEGKKLTNHPITIVNGDIQYIDLIAKYGKDWDLLGVNAYRGKNFTSLWKDVDEKLDKPVVFFEFGSDAFNALDFKEDQKSQAIYLQSQWQDMYNNTYDKGYGNALGGFVFEFRDEWWKYKQDENLDVHDRTASWSNGGYSFDYKDGVNNMNEEWFGIMRLGDINKEGVYIAEPRMAYDVLSQVFKLNPISDTKNSIEQSFNLIDINAIEKQVAIRDEKNNWGEKTGLRLDGGSITFDAINRKYDTFNPNTNEDDTSITEFTQSAFLNFAYDNKQFSSKLGLNFTGDAANSDFTQRYEDRVAVENEKKIEIYNFEASYKTDAFDLNGFYHVPRYHWGDEGDFYGLLRETTDMEGQDIWDAKAPAGLEFIGKKDFDGLKIVAGPEVYWGANPKAIIKYQFGKDKQYAIVHSQDYGEANSSGSSSTDIASSKTKQTTLYGKFYPIPNVKVELAGIIAGTEKINEEYDYLKNGLNYIEKIKYRDTIGAKMKTSFSPTQNSNAYVGLSYAGLVANGGEAFRQDGTELPLSEDGNKIQFDGGIQISNGYFTYYPRVLVRENIVDANPLIKPSISGTTLTKGIVPRNSDDDPFAVYGNRAAKAAEFILTYDPTPETYFYSWDNDFRENADMAYNLGITYIDYSTATDAYLFNENGTNYAFESGLDEQKVWLAKSRLIFNTNKQKWIVNFQVGKQQSTGLPADAVNFSSVETKLVWGRNNIVSLMYAKDKWGQYDYHRQFNTTYPEQYKFEYTRLLDRGLDENQSSKIGIRFFYRTLDAGAEGEWKSNDQYNDNMSEIQAYYTLKF